MYNLRQFGGLRRVTGMLDADVYLSPVHAPIPSNEGYFMFVGIGVRLNLILSSAFPKHKWDVTKEGYV